MPKKNDGKDQMEKIYIYNEKICELWNNAYKQ